MNTLTRAHIALDLHSQSSTLGYMDEQGRYRAQHQFPTTAQHLINHIVAIPAGYKRLTIEQGNMTFWAAEQLQDYVDELIVCDPRHNRLITAAENKADGLDTCSLCTLLRLGNLREVWRPQQLGVRRVFFGQVKQYQRLRNLLANLKRQLQASLRHWGVNVKLTARDYRHPERVLSAVQMPLLGEELQDRIGFIQQVQARKDAQLKRLVETGKPFEEIPEFMKIPGIGPVGAHTFSGYVQTPHRFRTASQLIKFCKLAVRHFTSDGRRVRSPRLSRSGYGCLKNVAHVAWKAAQSSDNEVSRYYQDCLENGGNPTHARLATQRKILTTMWVLWRTGRPYDPTRLTYKGDSTR